MAGFSPAKGMNWRSTLAEILKSSPYKVLETSERAPAVGECTGTFLNVSRQLRKRLYRQVFVDQHKKVETDQSPDRREIAHLERHVGGYHGKKDERGSGTDKERISVRL